MIDGVTLLRIVLSLAVVIASILAFARILRQQQVPHRAAGCFETLASEPVEGGGRLHLFRVARRIYLVAQGPGGHMNRLDAWAEDDFPLEALALDGVDEDEEEALPATEIEPESVSPRRRAWDSFQALGRLRRNGRVR